MSIIEGITIAQMGLRDNDLEQVFSITPLRDTCVEAAIRASKSFSGGYPGWELYCKIVRSPDEAMAVVQNWRKALR